MIGRHLAVLELALWSLCIPSSKNTQCLVCPLSTQHSSSAARLPRTCVVGRGCVQTCHLCRHRRLEVWHWHVARSHTFVSFRFPSNSCKSGVVFNFVRYFKSCTKDTTSSNSQKSSLFLSSFRLMMLYSLGIRVTIVLLRPFGPIKPVG